MIEQTGTEAQPKSLDDFFLILRTLTDNALTYRNQHGNQPLPNDMAFPIKNASREVVLYLAKAYSQKRSELIKAEYLLHRATLSLEGTSYHKGTLERVEWMKEDIRVIDAREAA